MRSSLLAWAALSALCLAVGAVLKYPEAVEPPGSDTGMFATYGALLLQGARPYVDFWDLHPPVVYVYWAVIEAVTGSDWLRTCPSIDQFTPASCTGLLAHGLDLLLSVAAAITTAGIARRAGASQSVAALAAVLVVGFADQSMLSQEGSNPSKLTLLPSSIAVCAYLGSQLETRHKRRIAVLAGAAGALAGLAKQPALLTLVAVIGHAAWRRDRATLVGLLLGATGTLALACAALAAVGSLDGFIAQAWVYNLQRAMVGYFVHPIKAPVIGQDRVLAEAAGVLVVLALVGAYCMARLPLRSAQGALLVWALVNLVAVTAFREFVYVVPSFAVLAAFGCDCLWRRYGAARGLQRVLRRGLLVAALAASVVLTTGFQRVQFARARYEHRPGTGLTAVEDMGQLVLHALPSGPLFVYGNGAELYPLSGRMPATRYLNAEALRSTAPGVEGTRAELVASLRASPPPVIVLAPHSDEAELNLAEYPAMRALLQGCYAREPVDPALQPNWTVLVQTGACSI